MPLDDYIKSDLIQAGLLNDKNSFNYIEDDLIQAGLKKDPKMSKPGFISDIKRGGGQAISALGSTLQDIGPRETGEAIQSYGEKVVRRNPSQINTVEEALSSPFTTAREAIGEVIPQVGISALTGMAGRAIGGAIGGVAGSVVPGVGTVAGAAVGQTIGGAGGAYVGNLIQEYGGIRADQREAGMNDVGRALMTGGAAAVLDTALGAERLTNKVLGKGSSFLQREAGTSLTKNIAKQGAIGLAEEAGTETIQTGLERYGAFKELTGAEAYNEYGLSAIKGGIGGGVIRGGMAGIAGERRPENSLLGGSFDNNTNNVTSNADAIKGAINVNAGPGLSTQEIVNQTVGVVDRQKKEQEALIKQRQADMTAAMNEPTGRKIADPATGVERDETAFDVMQRQAGPDSQQVATANAQANQQKAQQQTEEEIAQQAASRKTILDKFGTTPVFNEQGAQIGVKFNGNMYFSGMTNKLNEAVDKILVEEAAKPELTHHVEFAWLDAFKNQNTDKTITPKSLAGKVEAYLAGATNIDDVLDRVKAEIKDLEGKKGKSTAAQLGFLENFRDNLIGETNGIQTEQQVPAGVGDVSVEGRAAETGTGDLGLLQSNGIRPIGTGSDNGVQNGQQDVGGGEAVPRDYAGGAITSTVPNGQETGQVNEQLPITNGESQAGGVEGAENADRASDEFFEQNRQQFERENNSPEGQRWRRETGLDYAYLSQDLKDKWTRAVSTGNVTSRLVKNILADFDEKPNYAVMLADRIIVKNNAMDANTEPKIKRLFAYLISTPLNEQLTPVELKTLYGVTENTVSNWRKRASEIVDEEGNFKAGWSETTKKLLPGIIAEIKQKYNIENDATLAKLLTLGNNDLSSDISDIESEIKQELGQYEVELNVKNKEGQEEETGVKESSRKSISVNEQYNLGESVGTKGVKLIQQIKDLEAKIDAATANDDSETVDELTLKKEDLEADLAAAEVLAKKAQKLSKTQNLSKKGAENAFQEQSTDERNVRKSAEGGQAVGEGNAKPENTSREVVVKVEKKKQRAPKVEEKTTKETKSAAQLWDALGAPVKYDGLSPTGKADWALAVKDNKGNLITANKIFETEQKVESKTAEQLADESRTIEGEARIVSVGEKEQVKLITDQTSSLTDAQNTRLEQHYKAKRGTEEFISKVKDDVLKYVTKGAEAVAGAVRDIIKQIANGVMSIAIVLNPNLASDPIKIIVPTYETRTEQVIQKAPSTVAKNMSPAAQRAYEVIYPTIKDELAKTNKLFIITDKPTATQFIFNPDGTLLFQSKVLVAKSFGDFMKGDNNIDANKITPAGLMKLVQRTNTSSTKGYDFDTVYGVEGVNENTGDKYFTTLMHSVWLSEKDAQQRQQALKESGPQNSRYSFGCINVDKDTFGKVLKGHENQMNGATLFVVPDNQENVMEFVNGKAVLEKDIARQGITPKTKTVTEKVGTETVAGTKGTQLAAKEEKLQLSKQEKTTEKSTTAQIAAELKDFIGLGSSKVVRIVQSITQLPPLIQQSLSDQERVGGFVTGAGKAYLIADNINPNDIRAVFLHEVGSHLGLQEMLGDKEFNTLIDKINEWAGNKNSVEGKIAIKALERVAAAKTSVDSMNDELLAYFIEEAVKAGINPTVKYSPTPLGRFLSSIVSAFKRALRKLGFTSESLTAEDVVDLAYGAAHLVIQENILVPTNKVQFSFAVNNFKKWFGNSKIVNQDGTPKVMYHGTAQDIVEFRPKQGNAIFLTSSIKFAEDYANLRAQWGIESSKEVEKYANIMPVFVRAENPFDYSKEKHIALIKQNLFQREKEELDKEFSGWNWEDKLQQGEWSVIESPQVQAAIKRSEFDAFYVSEKGVRNLAVYSSNQIKSAIGNSGAYNLDSSDIRFSIQPISAIRAGAKNRIDALPPSYRGPVQAIFDTIQDAAKKGSIWASFTEDLALVAQKYIPSVTKYVGLMKERQAIKTKYERRVEEVLQDYEKLDKSVKGTGEGSVNKFLKDSTMGNKWGFQPSWIKEAVPIDKDIADRFNKMPDNAQKVIKKVFEHGFNTLSDMKQSVMSNITTEYDALIKEAEADEDAKEVSSLQKKKADALRDYRSLMSVQANSPYAPLKRFGNYVVAGKSQEYLNAEEAKDRKTIEKLQKDGDHYFVQFAETWAEAKAIARSQEGNYAFVEPFEKDDAERAMYGGKDVSDVFQRFRTMADDSLGDLSNKSKKTIDSLLLNLQLALLSDQSARQSENRRKGIAGAEDDMMRSFATQGRASAHFISTLHNTSAIYDQLRNMKKEADASTTGRGDRRRYYNEFMKRHAMAFNYESNPLLDKALGITSMWMLLTNPAYYLQNLTQPYMMSMPVMAAKHGYAKTTSAMMQGYKDIASVIRSEGLNEKTYSKLPADVREAIETLVNSGRIDISLESDLGRWQSTEEKNLASVAIEKLRSISQDVESINRVVTAVAAYRLEKQDGASQADAIAYADKVIIDTHGDYSGFNAPRFTRQGVGRLMTQFRKFQLIQISLMAKLINQSFKGVGKNAEETKQIRLVGKKALIYTLSHTFAMAGVMGMPGFAAIAWIVGAAFGDEDEPDNPEATLRKIIGDNAVADVLLKGIPKLLGVDLSGKLGMGQMLSILPYTEIDLSRDGYAKALAASMGPFLGGLLPKVIDGIGLMTQGNYYKGLAALAPTGLGNAVKAFELLDKGVVKRNGDVVLSADDISTLDAMSQALGLPTNKITDKQFIMSSEFKADKFYSERTTELKTEYTQAFRKGDTEEMGDIRRKWEDTQLARVRNGLKRQPISELFRAPQEQLKRQRDIKGGIVKPSLASGFVTER